MVSKSQRRSMALVSNDRRERQGKYGHLWFERVIRYHYIYICTTVEKDQRDSEFVSFQTNQMNEVLLCVFFYKALEKNELKVAIFF